MIKSRRSSSISAAARAAREWRRCARVTRVSKACGSRRPLLRSWREEIDAYVAKHGLAFREDASNAELAFTRNRLRHEAIPRSRESARARVRRAIGRAAEILRDEDEFLASLPGAHAQAGGTFREALARASPWRFSGGTIHGWLRASGVRAVGFEEVEAVRAMLTGRVREANLPGGWHARRRAGGFSSSRRTRPGFPH